MSKNLEQMMARILKLERRVEELERKEGVRLQVCADNVTDPPTNAELDTAFLSPEGKGKGFAGISDDAGADTTIRLIVSTGTSWFYSAKWTKAV